MKAQYLLVIVVCYDVLDAVVKLLMKRLIVPDCAMWILMMMMNVMNESDE